MQRALLAGRVAPVQHQRAGIPVAAQIHLIGLANHAYAVARVVQHVGAHRDRRVVGTLCGNQQRLAAHGVEAQAHRGAGVRGDALLAVLQFRFIIHALGVQRDGVVVIGHQRRRQRIAEAIDARALAAHHLRAVGAGRLYQGEGVTDIRP